MLIDFHTHFFPDKIAINTVSYLRRKMIELELIQHPELEGEELYPICTDATYKSTIDVMNRSEVDKFVLLPVATNETQVANVNKYAEKMRSDNIISFGAVYPYQKDYEYVLEDLKIRGFKGIKLHPEEQNIQIDSPEAIRVMKKAADLGMYIVVHAGEYPGYEAPFHSSPKQFLNAMQEVDGSKIVAAHLGGINMFDDVEKYLVGTDIILDTAYISKVIDFEQYKRIILNHGAEKVIFGSDCPWQDPQETLEDLKSLNLDDEAMELITHKNAERMLGL